MKLIIMNQPFKEPLPMHKTLKNPVLCVVWKAFSGAHVVNNHSELDLVSENISREGIARLWMVAVW